MKVLGVNKEAQTIQLAITNHELMSPAKSAEGDIVVEYPLKGSEKWCGQPAEAIGMRVARLVQDNPGVVEVHVRAGKEWTIKMFVKLHNLLLHGDMLDPESLKKVMSEPPPKE